MASPTHSNYMRVQNEARYTELQPIEMLILAEILVSRALKDGLPFPADVDGESHARRADNALLRAIGEFGGRKRGT